MIKNLTIGLICGAVFLNFLNALTPEISFDALWYHLTIPKIYLTWGKIDFISGGLLYYSAMPKLGELLFMLVGANDVYSHLIHFSFGLGSAFITYKIAKIYLDSKYSLLATLIFYVTPLVSWLSSSAYIDLIRTFFEALAFYMLLKERYWLMGLSLALAVGTKTLALGSLLIFYVLVFLKSKSIHNTLYIILYTIILSSPWFVISYLWTGNPFYPIGAGILDGRDGFQFPRIFDLWKLFIDSSDPFNPIYLIIFPVSVKFFKKIPLYIILYTLYSGALWLFTPRTDWGRFLLPYLPVWSIAASYIISQTKSRFLIYLVVFISIINIGYRLMASKKNIPYLLGKESKIEYLCKNLDFKTSVFVDCDEWFAKNIKSTDLVLVKNVHNLYYINFPFVHESWYKGEKYNYVLTYNQTLDKTLVHKNETTGMMLYAN